MGIAEEAFREGLLAGKVALCVLAGASLVLGPPFALAYLLIEAL
jgi:hypothetical protein